MYSLLLPPPFVTRLNLVPIKLRELLKKTDDEKMNFLSHAASGCNEGTADEANSKQSPQQSTAEVTDSATTAAEDDTESNNGKKEEGKAETTSNHTDKETMEHISSCHVCDKERGMVMFRMAWSLVQETLWREQV